MNVSYLLLDDEIARPLCCIHHLKGGLHLVRFHGSMLLNTENKVVPQI